MAIPLGRAVAYRDTLDPTLLFPIARDEARNRGGVSADLFDGVDVWRAYELSWLDPSGKPNVAIAEIVYSANSPHIVESKSLKLFLGSFNNHVFDDVMVVQQTVEREISGCIGAEATAEIFMPTQWRESRIAEPTGECIDQEPWRRGDGRVWAETEFSRETLVSNLLRSLCPVTGQPDWGTVLVDYAGRKLNRGSILDYLVHHRSYQGFHEECCERLFSEVVRICEPSTLAVACCYTRRGGIDINPVRWLRGTTPPPRPIRLARQ
jgi:7-cyano-7-deazaguanine reductase